MLSVHYVGAGGSGDVRVTFSLPIDAADYQGAWLELEDVADWVAGDTVSQDGPSALLFNNVDYPNALGTSWRLTNHPPGLAAPYSGTTT